VTGFFGTFFPFIFVLGVLIFVHELGHYLMAKRIGVRVITFSLGFGPKIVGFRRGDTEYCLSAIPLGGYVKMAGETPDEELTGKSDEFLSKSKWQRFQVLIMGPVMNIVLAIVLMAVVLTNGAQVPAFQDRQPIVGAIAAGSPAQRAGVVKGDRILTVAGRQVDTWEQFYMAIGTRANREVPMTILHEGRTTAVKVTPDSTGRFEIGDIGVLPDVHPSILGVTPGDPAEKVGILKGDVVTDVNGETIIYSKQLSDTIAKHAEEPITIELLRHHAPITVKVTPVRHGKIGWIGVSIGDEFKIIKPGPLRAVTMSFQRNYQFSGDIVRTIWGLVSGETSPKQLMGPIAIAQLSGDYAAEGWMMLFTLMASISLNLGLLNLLPIPVLDGGHIFIMALEGLARRDFSVRVKEKMLLAGFVLLMMLMVTVMYNDLTRIPSISRLMFWR
jgi:regulator of sigma E protease